MRIVDYQTIQSRRRQANKKKQYVRRGFVVLVLCVFVSTTFYIAFQKPLPSATYTVQNVSEQSGSTSTINWPGYGQMALGNKEYGILETNGQQVPAPTASVAKVMTALAVLQKHPLVKGQPIPKIVIDAADVASYKYYLTHDGSNVKVELGEEITQYQALQALLLPSANNMAETLARWAFGSLEEYTAYANNFAKSLGMQNSNFADPSGFSPKTVSTASDLVLLGIAAMDEPTIAEIVAQTSAVIPVAGQIKNTNRILGTNGIKGIKTGNTNEAGGCLLFVGETKLGDKTIDTVGAVMGAPSIGGALNDAVTIVNSAYQNYETSRVANSNQTIVDYNFEWGATNAAYVKEDLDVAGWKGADITVNISPEVIEVADQADAQVGVIIVSTPLDKKIVPLYLKSNTVEPNIWWRLKHLF